MTKERLSQIQRNILNMLQVLEKTTDEKYINRYSDSNTAYWSYFRIYEATKLCYADQGKLKEYNYNIKGMDGKKIKELYELLHPDMKGKTRYDENSYKASFSRSLRNLSKKGLIHIDKRHFKWNNNGGGEYIKGSKKVASISLTDKGREVLMLKSYFNNKDGE